MDLNLSNRGLFSFDAVQAKESLMKVASHISHASGVSAASMTSALPIIRQLNLSFNSLHIFTGGETLRGLAVLDLSHNELAQLRGSSLPSTLVRLNLSHNRLAQLAQLEDCTPRLQELDVSHNQLSASALRGLPVSLTLLNAEGNTLESLTPFSTLLHLGKLNVAHNQLGSLDTLQSLRPLLSLRFLDLRSNPICSLGGACDFCCRSTVHDASIGSGDVEARRRGEQPSLLRVLNNVVPRLSHLNGIPLSQAPENRILKSERQAQERKQERLTSSKRSSTRGEGGSAVADKSYASSSSRDVSAVARRALEVRLMQAKVSELRRLLLAAQDAEGKARQERALLTESVKSTSLVIDQQAAELERLQADIAQLQEEERLLRVPIAAAEESFEQVHASLLATKVKSSATGLK